MRDQFDKDGIILENALAFWVNRFYETTRRAMYRAFREQGYELTPEQWIVLVRLWERDGRTQSDLAAACHRDAPTMSRILDSMSKAGLVARAVDETDARTRLIVLTPKGREAKKTLLPLVRKLVAELEGDIPERDLEITRRTLRRIVERLD